MLVGIFLILIIIEIGLLFSYSKNLNEVVRYSISSGDTILERSYSSVYELYSDVGFLNSLLDGGVVASVENDVLRVRLVKLRKLLLFQLLFGTAIFITGIAPGFIY